MQENTGDHPLNELSDFGTKSASDVLISTEAGKVLCVSLIPGDVLKSIDSEKVRATA